MPRMSTNWPPTAPTACPSSGRLDPRVARTSGNPTETGLPGSIVVAGWSSQQGPGRSTRLEPRVEGAVGDQGGHQLAGQGGEDDPLATLSTKLLEMSLNRRSPRTSCTYSCTTS